MLEIRNVSKKYPGSKDYAIQDINLVIQEGDIYGFIGPNGAGKSTLIKSIVGIHDFEGEIKFNDISIKEDPIKFKSDIAYIPDNPTLYEHLTGVEYINFILNIFNVKENKEKDILELAEIFSLGNKIYDPISSYSHGMQQKISIMAALLHDPKVLILDEPFVGLDPKATYELKEKLKSLCETKGLIVFFSSHVLDVVEKFCNKISIIKKGKIVESGETQVVKGEGSLEDKFMEIFNE
ncbi:MAG: ABC transporter ATP-binding protein [Acholeplasmatales bacterium]|nr:ABC transporter ATP-binding protein [Acholeplasmatales bacterium]